MKKPTVLELSRRKGERMAMLTAYDYPSARLVAEAGVDLILVGDSLGMVVLGYDSTTPVTLEDMVHHTRAARRGAPDAFLIADLPFLSYGTLEQALESSARLMKEAGIQEPAYLNMVVTNGLFVVGTRYVSDPSETPLTLYHTEATHYAVENGVGRISPVNDNEKAILVVSERLSDEKDWTIVPPNHFVIVDHALNVSTRPIVVT